MNTSELIFISKTKKPDEAGLKKVLGKTFSIWNELINYVSGAEKNLIPFWNYSGPKFGWSFRIKDKKRVIIYMLPMNGYFIVSLVYGEKATAEALNSNIADDIKKIISSAKVYAEGRGFRLEVKDKKISGEIKKLIGIKLRN